MSGRFHHYPALSHMYCCRLVRMAILTGWIWFLVVILIGISPVILGMQSILSCGSLGFLFLREWGNFTFRHWLLESWLCLQFISAVFTAGPFLGVSVYVPSRFNLVQLFVTLWTTDHQSPLSMGFSRKEYWSGLSSPPPRDLPDPGIEPASWCLLHWQAVLYH